MPVCHRFDGAVVVVRAEGAYTPDDLKDAMLRAFDDHGCPAHPVLLYDLSASTSLAERTPAQVRDMAEFLVRHQDRFNRRLGMLVGSDHDYGLMRMGSVFAELGGVAPAVFKSYDAARTWLVGAPRPDD